MLNEPILGVLPATEEQVLAAFPRVHPDPLLRRLRRLEKAYVIEKMRDGRYDKTLRTVELERKTFRCTRCHVDLPEDAFKFRLDGTRIKTCIVCLDQKRKDRKKPDTVPCRVCGKPKDRIKDFPRSSRRCFSCRPKRAVQFAESKRRRRVQSEA